MANVERPGRDPLASLCLAKGWRLFQQRRFLLRMHFLCAQGGDASVPEAREGQARCLARQAPAEVRAGHLFSSCCSGCEHLPPAAGPELWLWMLHHSCGATWQRGTEAAPAWMFVMTRSQSAIPAFSYPPSPLPPCLGWQLDVFFLRLSLGNSPHADGSKTNILQKHKLKQNGGSFMRLRFLTFKILKSLTFNTQFDQISSVTWITFFVGKSWMLWLRLCGLHYKGTFSNSPPLQMEFNFLDFFLLDFKLTIEKDLFTMVGVWCNFPSVGEHNDQREETAFNC